MLVCARPDSPWQAPRHTMAFAADPKDETTRVWRYMSFSRFLWLLQNNKLWLARADTLNDPWELAIAGEQLEFVISRHPQPSITRDFEGPRETAIERVKRISTLWRSNIFVNCWSASEHEFACPLAHLLRDRGCRHPNHPTKAKGVCSRPIRAAYRLRRDWSEERDTESGRTGD